MPITTFINKVKTNQSVSFDDTMHIINEHYQYTPTTFSNGLGDNSVTNAAGSNEGSCKIFAFAQLNQLDQQHTLNLFGDFYHQDVLNDPDGNDHQNIRNFMQYGWEGIQFSETNSLRLK
ncbi:MAG: hypothetical protein methR_P2528 [Methyloprofundus sp.]|nr:MAG: hypothetical protein methR_P2528 [Methyloprofundus sp.]